MNDDSFWEKFFGFPRDEWGNRRSYIGKPVADPTIDIQHFIWILIVVILSFTLYLYVKNNKDKARPILITLSVIIFSLRLFDQLIFPIVGLKLWAEALPFHLCDITTLTMGLVAIFNVKWAKDPIYVLGIMGAIITMLAGEIILGHYYSFYLVISIVTHSLLIMIPLVEIASGTWRLDIMKTPIIFGWMLVFMAWAYFANHVIFKGLGKNYMYLEKNGLPYNFGGKYYFLVYVGIFFFLYACVFVPVYIYRYKHKTVVQESE